MEFKRSWTWIICGNIRTLGWWLIYFCPHFCLLFSYIPILSACSICFFGPLIFMTPLMFECRLFSKNSSATKFKMQWPNTCACRKHMRLKCRYQCNLGQWYFYAVLTMPPLKEALLQIPTLLEVDLSICNWRKMLLRNILRWKEIFRCLEHQKSIISHEGPLKERHKALLCCFILQRQPVWSLAWRGIMKQKEEKKKCSIFIYSWIKRVQM